MTRHTVDESILVLIRQLLQRSVLRLGQQQRREHARQHEQREDLEDMLHEVVLAADVLQAREADLRDDRAELARRGGDAVRGRAVPRGERLAGDDKRRRVRAEVLEEVRDAVEEDEDLCPGGRCHELRVGETHDREKDGEHSEAHELNRLASPGVNEQERRIISWDKPCGGEDEVPDADVLEVGVDGCSAFEASGG